MEGVAIATCNKNDAPALFFLGGCCGEKVVCLVAWGLCILEAARGYKLWDEIKLLNQSVIKFAPTLIIGKCRVPMGKSFQSVPRDQNSPRLLLPIKAQSAGWQSPKSLQQVCAHAAESF